VVVVDVVAAVVGQAQSRALRLMLRAKNLI
jgi:hypothetical protein